MQRVFVSLCWKCIWRNEWINLGGIGELCVPDSPQGSYQRPHRMLPLSHVHQNEQIKTKYKILLAKIKANLQPIRVFYYFVSSGLLSYMQLACQLGLERRFEPLKALCPFSTCLRQIWRPATVRYKLIKETAVYLEYTNSLFFVFFAWCATWT